ncbi:LytTR family DNA-binding domain-containing protein [Prevotella sp. MGM1]|uniref:LytR/AlgR family response regulator transcription factor n=1 Tax=Prevotella sp. MGM1 TaxID=2033405 RepID=UPI000CEA1BD5|nr:LytTR family DNA-binding domain-containing protein [Prevotella sp. MGM1]GAY28273.1 DNA-binding response regulator [Prevotella sp. MGM1]
MTLNCIIIDDEPLACELLASYARKTPFITLRGTYNSAISAMKDIRNTPVDLIFLDIQMPELSGIEFARIIPKETKIIFTTAFDQYALHGYKVNAIDYLLKPISYNDFIMSADKALEWFSSLKNKTNDDGNRFIMIKSDYKLIRISLDDILYIEGQKDYIRIYMNNGEKIMSLINLKTLEQHLPEPEFMRTHRSYIVHMDKITVLDRLRIVFGNKHIPISDSYKDNIMAYFDKHTLS